MTDDQVNENHEATEASHEADSVTETDQMTPDQLRIAEWHAAVEAAPDADEMTRRRQSVTEAEEMLRDAETSFRTGAVERALVYGWTTVAEQVGETAKKLHGWQREYQMSNMPDLSTVPEKEMAREERKIREEEERLARATAVADRLAARRARLEAAQKGVK